MTNFELQYLSPREFSAFRLPEVERWFAVIRTTGRISVGDFERESKKARNLKERFLSNQSHADVDQLEWVTRWSGTKGAGAALLLSWPAGRRFSPVFAADLLQKKTIGDWEDIHGVVGTTLVCFSTTHEGEVAVRTRGGGERVAVVEVLHRGEPVDPAFTERLLR